jgi:hypothetical protein
VENTSTFELKKMVFLESITLVSFSRFAMFVSFMVTAEKAKSPNHDELTIA